MTSSFKVKLNEIVKKKMIKLHEQYKSSGKEEEFLEIINVLVMNYKSLQLNDVCHAG